jgi:hypothetical protein
MAIKKKTLPTAPDPEPDPEPQSNNLPNFDQTRAEVDPETLMDQAIKDAKTGGFEKLPTGNWVGVVNKIDTWKSEKGFFYRIHLICHVDDDWSFRHIIWCHILLDDMRTMHEWGPVFYARHIAALGYSKNDDQKWVRDQINSKQPGVIVTSTPNKKNPDWNDVAIRDRLSDDNEEVQGIREQMDNQPY